MGTELRSTNTWAQIPGPKDRYVYHLAPKMETRDVSLLFLVSLDKAP